MFRRLLLVGVGVALASTFIVSCGGRGETQRSREITVVSREAGSGTRGAFDEIMKIDEGGTNKLLEEAVVQNSSDAIATTVEGDRNAIGYTSLGSVTPGVKAISVNGVAPTVVNVQNGSYTVSRPFVLATLGTPDPLAVDFLRFVTSPAGQQIVSGRGLVPMRQPGDAYTPGNLSGTLTLSGSTSLERIIASLREEYVKLNPNIRVEANHGGSGAGIRDAINGRAMLGMSSRALNASELEQLRATEFALDAIAVIVNRENDVSNLSSGTITGIFKGETRDWNNVQ
jgi:phosphate transport system substrate-binding protein